MNVKRSGLVLFGIIFFLSFAYATVFNDNSQVDFDLIDASRNDNSEVKVIYSLTEISGVDQNVEIQFLLYNFANEKVSEFTDNFVLGSNEIKEFESLIPVEKSLVGDFNLLVNLNSDTYSSFVQESLVLGPGPTGFAVFGDRSTSGTVLFSLFGVMFLVFVGFMVVRIMKFRKKAVRTKDYS